MTGLESEIVGANRCRALRRYECTLTQSGCGGEGGFPGISQSRCEKAGMLVMGLGGEAWRGRFCKACREPAGRFVGGGRRQADKSPGTREGGRLGAWPDTSRRARPISWSRTPAPQTSRPAGVPAHKSSAHAGPPEAAPGAGKTPASADKPTDESSSALAVLADDSGAPMLA